MGSFETELDIIFEMVKNFYFSLIWRLSICQFIRKGNEILVCFHKAFCLFSNRHFLVQNNYTTRFPENVYLCRHLRSEGISANPQINLCLNSTDLKIRWYYLLCFYSFKHRSHTVPVLGGVSQPNKISTQRISIFNVDYHENVQNFRKESQPMRDSFYFLALYSFPGRSCHWKYYPKPLILCFCHESKRGITQRASGNSELP